MPIYCAALVTAPITKSSFEATAFAKAFERSMPFDKSTLSLTVDSNPRSRPNNISLAIAVLEA